MTIKTAILIFANSAQYEATQKPFQSSELLFAALNAQTLATVKKTALPYFLSSEDNQIGSNFGERFTNAIQSVYDKGYTSVITIGNDTPHLQPKHILKARKQLEQNDIVLGPSTDGGFYLMGLKKTYISTSTFLKLPWQTRYLHQSISKLIASKSLSISYLEPLSDIDSTADITAVIERFRSLPKGIKHLLLHYISVEKTIITSLIISIETSIQKRLFNKGSPVLLHF